MNRPARPPRPPLGRGDRRIVLIFAAVVLGIGTLAVIATFVLGPETDDADATPIVTATAISELVTPAPATPDVAVATPRPPASCADACIVRLTDQPDVREALAGLGVIPNYAHAGQLWAAVPPTEVDRLRAAGREAAIVAESNESLPLYVVRVPETMDPAVAESTITGLGEVVDQIGNQFIVQATELPPPVRPLVAEGIWIEKFPPSRAVSPLDPEAQRQFPPLDDLASLAEQVSTAELEATMRDLQAMSSTDGTGVGTRHYTTTGNVMAGEYLYRRFANYGLDVWFEDFVTDDGLLVLNVVAELPGDDPSEAYLVLGHYDSLNDLSGPDQSESPGADDNASGVAGMVEIARLLSQRRLSHPVRFFATNVEEVGLQGVKSFGRRLSEEGREVAGAYNLDAIGSAAHGTQLVLNGDASSAWLEEILVDVNDRFGLGQALLVRQNPVIVADDNFLRDAGVPTILVARELFGWSSVLHTPDDTMATVDMSNVRGATQLVLLGVAALV
ncbi:MAG: M28 family peptidase, partial [Thermomicrobiales bacterium]